MAGEKNEGKKIVLGHFILCIAFNQPQDCGNECLNDIYGTDILTVFGPTAF